MVKIQDIKQILSREKGTIIKDWGGRIPFALIYPNYYYLGMSNLGIHAIYNLLNNYPDIVCERVFWEQEDKNSQSPILSLESQRPISDFAILAFSITYELDYFNAIQVLKSSGIPLFATDRDDRHPLIIAGGPCIIANPMPLAPFFDCLCVGEAEAILPNLLPVLSEGIKGNREDLLKELSQLPGIYVPEYHIGTPKTRQWLPNLDDYPAHSIILTPNTELGNMYLIEVERGCNWGCRFCLVSNAFSPMRFHSLDNLFMQAETGLKYNKRLGLVGPAVSDHPQFEELITGLKKRGAELSVSSLRIKPLHPTALREIAGGGAQTITLAPEAGSHRLRQLIKKGIDEDDILKAVSLLSKQDIKQLKLYFMIGLPMETDHDIEAIVDLTLKCKDILDSRKKGCRINLGISPFVPKAGTPFQWLPMEQLPVLNHRLAFLKNKLRPNGIKVSNDSLAWSQVQGVLARGGVDLAEVLADIERLSLSAWRKAANKHKVDIDSIIHQCWDTEERLPWAVLESGTETGHLKLQLDKAFE